MKILFTWGSVVLAASLLAAEAPDGAGSQAGEIFKATGVDRGFCVHVGVTDGGLTVALAGNGRFVVHGLGTDAVAVEKARRLIRSHKVYGSVSVDRAGPGPLPYADNLVNLLVVDDFPAAVTRGFDLGDALRVIVPNGVACFSAPAGKVDAAALAAAGFKDARLSGAWTIARKPRPPAMGDWTHARQGPERTNTGDDLLLGPPRQLRWIDGPRRSTYHQGAPTAAVSAGGRFFYIADGAMPFTAVPPSVRLVARDAFNGVMLWSKPLHGKLPGAGALVASDDRVYAVLEGNGPVVCLDAASGEVIRTYEGTRPTELMLAAGLLMLVEGGGVRALDPSSGAVQWSAKAEGRDNGLLLGGQRLFVLGERSKGLTCLDPASGKALWTKDEPEFQGKGLAGFAAGTVVLAGGGNVAGVSAETGKSLWRYSFRKSVRSYAVGVYFSDGLVWVCNKGENSAYGPGEWQGLDPATGQVKRSFSGQFTDKCAPGVATRRFLITGRLDFFDTRDGRMTSSAAARGVCRFGSIVANGLVYTFPNDCVCSPYVNGLMALAGEAGTPGRPLPAEKDERLEPGPGAAAGGKAPGKDDWPIYRQNPERMGSATTALPVALRELWSVELGSGLTAPTIADGKVFVATADDHRVHALDASEGRILWSFDTGGRVDSPPTFHQGLAIFGCHDGRVYCLNAESGQRIWSFRAAPGERKVLAYGQPESAWPVIGSLPIVDGRVLAVAGRHTALDGGMRLCALDALSGKLLWEKTPGGPDCGELMVLCGARMVAGALSFDPATGENSSIKKGKIKALSFGSSFDDPSYSVRTQWRSPGGVSGQMLALDASRVLGFHGNRTKDKYSITEPAKGQYAIFLNDEKARIWEVTVMLRPSAVLLAGDKAFVAGSPDVYPFQGGQLRWYAATDGRELGTLDLGAVPVHDGMAAAAGRLYVSTQDGKLHGFGKP